MKIVANYLSPLWKGTKSFGKTYVNFVFGTQNEAFASELTKLVKKDGYNNLGKNIKDVYNATKPAAGTSFWKNTWSSIKTIPGEFSVAGKAAKGFWGKLASPLKVLGKKMPLIGNIIMVAMELPNIFKAFKNGGVGAGIKEIGKAGAKLGGFAAGAAIGQALIPIPFVGAMIGGLVGGWIAEKIVGKSFTEKQKEAEEKAQPEPATQSQQPNQNDQLAQSEQITPIPGIENPLMNNMTPEIMPQGQIQGQQPQVSAFGVNNPFASMHQQTTPMPWTNQNMLTLPNTAWNTDYRDKDFMALSAGLA